MDKFEVNASKRKKRRTRRNLDEMRKRTHQVHSSNINNETVCKPVKPQVKNCITNGRLTLGNKMIRSETVTRSLLATLNKEKNKNIIVLPNREEAIDTIVSNINYKKYIPFKINAKLKSPIGNYTEIHNHKTPDSIILFSSLESEKLVNNITISDVLSDSSSSEALSFVMQSDNSLYSEFMTNIANYVQEIASDFLKTDTVLKANFLQNVISNKNKNISSSQFYMNTCEVKTKLTITDNDRVKCQYSKSQNDINIQFSIEQPWNVSYPVFHQSREISFKKRISSSSSAWTGEDSPEYFYYPHRLNQ